MQLGVQVYGGSLGLLRVGTGRTAHRPLAVKPRGMECKCLARRNKDYLTYTIINKTG